jgi:hypothetical protein
VTPRKVAERGVISTHDRATGRSGRGGDDQVVRTARLAPDANLGEEIGVDRGDLDVVVQYRDCRDDLVDEGRSATCVLRIREQRTHSEFCHGHRSDRDVVIVVDDVDIAASGVNQECRVEEQPGHDRSSTSSTSRTDRRSPAQAGSGRC